MSIVLEKTNDCDKIKELYLRAFPRDERAPFSMIRRRARQGRADMLTARDGEEFVGFVYMVCLGDLAYIFYFAIDADKRGMGYGSAVLTELKKRYEGKRLFLAREQLDESADNYAQRLRRHEFYLRNGFEDKRFKIKEASVIYDAMGIGGEVSAEEYRELIEHWNGKFMRKLIDMRIIEA